MIRRNVMSYSQVDVRARVTPWGVYSAVFLLAATVVHAGTYVGRTLSPNSPFYFILHAGIFPVFIAFALRSQRWQRERRGPFGMRYRQLDWREWRPFLPDWAARFFVGLGLYAIANFVFASLHLPAKGTSAVLTDAQAMYT